MSRFSSNISALEWYRSYDRSLFRGDLNAGITVGIMLIPQGMAYAVLAGLPPIYGLYAAIVPLAIYAILGSSRQLAVGPVAMVSLLVFAGVSEFAEVGSARYIQLAIFAAFGVGLVQFFMGILRMGFLVNFLSHPVLSGFTSAAAIIIGASQIKSLLGLQLPQTANVVELILIALVNIGEIHLLTALIGVLSAVLVLSLKRWKKTFPSALFVVITGILVVWGFGLSAKGVAIVGEIPGGLPSFIVPSVEASDMMRLAPMILVIALVSFMESIAVAKAIANRKGYSIDANKELVALGAANVGGSLFQSFPTTGGFSRTAVNDQSGANTGLASLISALIVTITVLFLTPLFYYLPIAVLAAIIIVAVSTLFDAKTIRSLWKTDKRDFFVLMVTFWATLLIGIEQGIVIGMVISVVSVIYYSTRPHSAELGQLGETDNFRNVLRYPDAKVRQDVLVFRFDSPLYFTSASSFQELLMQAISKKGSALKYVVLDASSINYIDSSGIHTLKSIASELVSKGIALHFAGAIGPVRDAFKSTGLTHVFGLDKFHFDVAEAIYAIDKIPEELTSGKFSPVQSNI
jgi:sulfate permease, SulP family